MASYADLIERGGGLAEYYVQIEGCKYVFSTTDIAPESSWYTGEGFETIKCLKPGSIRRMCLARPGEVWPDMQSFDVVIDDPDETVGAYLKTLDGCTTTELTSSLDATTSGAVSVLSNAALGATGVIHVDREAIHYDGKDGTDSLTGLTRSYHGSEASEHILIEDTWPPCRPIVSDGPGGLRSRRVVIYIAEHPEGELGAPEQIFVGYVRGDHQSQGHEIRIPVAPALQGFLDGDVMGEVPSSPVRGLYIPNVEANRWGRCVFFDANNGAQYADIVTSGTVSFFEGSLEVRDAFIEEVNDNITDWAAGVSGDGKVYVRCDGTPTDTDPHIMCNEQGLLAPILGFDMGGTEDGIPAGMAFTDWGERLVASKCVATVFIPLVEMGSIHFEHRLYLRDSFAQKFVASMCVIDDHSGNKYYAMIREVNTTDDYLVINQDYELYGGAWPGSIICHNSQPDVRQIFGLKNYQIDEIVRVLWDGTSGETITFSIPNRWLPEPCLRDADVDWTTLKALVGTAPYVCRNVMMAVEEPKNVRELITGNLLACGVYAYIKEDGTVGWKRTGMPSQLDASGNTVTSEYIDATRAPDIVTERSRDKVISVVRFTVDWPRNPDRAFPIVISNNRSLQQYGIRAPSIPKVTKEIELMARIYFETPFADIAREAGNYMKGLLDMLGQPLPHVRLPVTLKGRAFEIGDAVLLTTSWVRDSLTGTMGVSSKVCLVAGWEREEGFTRNAVDWLDLIMIDRPAGAISPAALATGYTSGTGSLSFSDTDMFRHSDDDSDLQFFEAGDKIEGIQYNTATPDTFVAEVVSTSIGAGTGTMVITGLSGTMSLSAVIRFRDYINCTTDQQNEGWAFAADATSGVITSGVAGQRWSA